MEELAWGGGREAQSRVRSLGWLELGMPSKTSEVYLGAIEDFIL